MTHERIVFDLDGVLRSLTDGISAHVGCKFDPQSWDDPVCSGRRRISSICEYVNRHPEILVTSPPPAYYPELAGERITVLTCQPIGWIPYTLEWIRKWLPGCPVKFVQHPEEKLDYCRTNNCLIVEDYPNFTDNSRVVMVDRPYNRMVTGCKARVRTSGELIKIMEEMK